MKNQNTNKYSTTLSFKIDAKEKDYLYVKESQIFGSGKGLYTAIPIYKDEVISLFTVSLYTSDAADDGRDV
jgi:hypothetical protein